ncbi:MAG: hypothetical protein HY520_03840 [Candidatus Aenigmarchaeota archaeon]|nr:hypothetical protein [Candidatus Aenigmarchaeota archaeon]
MKKGVPQPGELVVCRVAKLYPNSAAVQLVEYDLPGMVHVSEVASRWVRDIREFLKENQFVVCRVVRMEGTQALLSMKRVRREDTTKALNEYKRENKAEAILAQVAKSLGKTLDQALKEVGGLLQEEFGSLTKALDMAYKNPELLKKKGVPPAWAKALQEMAQKRFGEKTYVLTAELELSSYQPDGIRTIKSVLGTAQREGLEVRYLSAPRYRLRLQGNDFKRLRARLEEVCQQLVRDAEQQGAAAAFTVRD